MIDDSLPLTDAVGAGDETPAKGKRRFDEERRLEPWERYRVLTDIAKLQLDMLEMADRRTRFALLILGTLNALNVLLVARPDLLAPAGVQVEPMAGIAPISLCRPIGIPLRPGDRRAQATRRPAHRQGSGDRSPIAPSRRHRVADARRIRRGLAAGDGRQRQQGARLSRSAQRPDRRREIWRGGAVILGIDGAGGLTASMLALVVVRMLLGSPTA
jgi:hypothetical protein